MEWWPKEALSTLGWTEEAGVTHHWEAMASCLREEAVQTEIAADLEAEQAL